MKPVWELMDPLAVDVCIDKGNIYIYRENLWSEY